MSDLFSRNNSYFTAPIYNSSQSQEILANFDISQISALVSKASDYQLALDKARLPLNIPLTPYNIPFKLYSVILRGTNSAGSEVYSDQSYVRQVGATTNSLNYIYNMDPVGLTFKKYRYSDAGVVFPSIGGFSLPTGSYGPMVVDGFDNLYVAFNALVEQSVFDTLLIYTLSGTLLGTYGFQSIIDLAISPNQNIYVANIDLGVSSVQKYNNDNSASSSALNLVGTILNDFAGSPITNVKTLSVDDQVYVFWNNGGSITLSTYDTTLLPVSDVVLPDLVNPKATSLISQKNRYVVTDDLSGADLVYGISGTNIILASTGNTMSVSAPFSQAPCFLGDGTSPTTFAFGSTTTNSTEVATFNNTSAPTITGPSSVNSSTTVQSIWLSPSQNNFGAINATTLSYWNLDNKASNIYTTIDPNFQVNSSNVKILGQQKGTASPLFTVCIDNNLYTSLTNWQPKCFLSSTVDSNLLHIEGFGANLGAGIGTGELINEFIVQGGTFPEIYSVFKEQGHLYALTFDTGSSTNFYINDVNITTGITNSSTLLTQTPLIGVVIKPQIYPVGTSGAYTMLFVDSSTNNVLYYYYCL